jgi:hypothetical protein
VRGEAINDGIVERALNNPFLDSAQQGGLFATPGVLKATIELSEAH